MSDDSLSDYRLLLVGDGEAPSRTGFVFCADETRARAAARALLEVHPEALAVEVKVESGPLCRLERVPPEAATS